MNNVYVAYCGKYAVMGGSLVGETVELYLDKNTYRDSGNADYPTFIWELGLPDGRYRRTRHRACLVVPDPSKEGDDLQPLSDWVIFLPDPDPEDDCCAGYWLKPVDDTAQLMLAKGHLLLKKYSKVPA